MKAASKVILRLPTRAERMGVPQVRRLLRLTLLVTEVVERLIGRPDVVLDRKRIRTGTYRIAILPDAQNSDTRLNAHFFRHRNGNNREVVGTLRAPSRHPKSRRQWHLWRSVIHADAKENYRRYHSNPRWWRASRVNPSASPAKHFSTTHGASRANRAIRLTWPRSIPSAAAISVSDSNLPVSSRCCQ